MTMHSVHEDTHTHGLDDGCERCAEHASHPFQSLDRGNLSRLMAIAADGDRFSKGYSNNDLVAAATIRTALERAGHLRATNPEVFQDFVERY